MGLEADCRDGENKLNKEGDENFDDKMVIYKDKTFTDLNTDRYDRDLNQYQGFRDFKSEELKKIKDE